MSDNISGSIPLHEGIFNPQGMESLAAVIADLESSKEGVRPFTEASTILQDYMDAWVMWNNQSGAEEEMLFSDYLFEVVAKRAVFITVNVQ